MSSNLNHCTFFASKLGMLVHYHEPKCCWKSVDCYLQSHGHTEGLISSDPLNSVQPNFGTLVYHHEVEFLVKCVGCYFQGQGHRLLILTNDRLSCMF